MGELESLGRVLIILLQRFPFSKTLNKLNYIQLTTARVKNKTADLTGSRSLRGHTVTFIAHEVLSQMAFK